jgi:MacB-like protein
LGRWSSRTAEKDFSSDRVPANLPSSTGKLDATSGSQARIGIPASDTPVAAQKPSDVYTPVHRMRAMAGNPVPIVGTAPSATPVADPQRILGSSALEKPVARSNFISPEYFPLLQIPVAQGRVWTRDEIMRGAPLAVINQTMARQYWSNGDAIGRQFRFANLKDEPPYSPAAVGADGWLELIGVVADARNDGLRNPIKAAFYVPYTLKMRMFTQILVRTRVPPLSLLRDVRAELVRVDREQQVMRVRDLQAAVPNMSPPRRIEWPMLTRIESARERGDGRSFSRYGLRIRRPALCRDCVDGRDQGCRRGRRMGRGPVPWATVSRAVAPHAATWTAMRTIVAKRPKPSNRIICSTCTHQPPASRSGFDLDLPVAFACYEARLVVRGRSVQHAAIVEGKLGPMPRTDDRAVFEGTLRQGTSEMGRRVREQRSRFAKRKSASGTSSILRAHPTVSTSWLFKRLGCYWL